MAVIKYEKIKKNTDFKRIFRTGKTTTGRFVFLKTKRIKNEKCRIGFVVGLTVSKKAVERNKIKRRIRATMKEFYDGLLSCYDIVVVAKKEILNKKQSEIKEDIIKTLEKSKIFEQ